MNQETDEMKFSRFSREVGFTLEELEPYLLDCKRSLYPCSISGFYDWVKDLFKTHTDDEILKMKEISWPMMFVLITEKDFLNAIDESYHERILRLVNHVIDVAGQ